MPSILASQLSKLSQLTASSHSSSKPSLLFDKKQAGQVDKDHILSLARTGLADLISQNTCFRDFEETIFSEKHKHQDRLLLVSCFLVYTHLFSQKKKI